MLQLPKEAPISLRGHIPALDAIRGLAIVAVTMFRFREGPVADLPTKLGRQVLDQGHFGVDLFFVLSGFLITGILFDSKEERGYFKNFYLRRTLRIFPLYYAALLVTLVILPRVLPPGSSVFAETSPYAPWLWFYGANLAQCWYQEWILGPFNHFWSLAIEEHFYLFWPLLIYLLNRRQAVVLSTACLVIGLVGKLTALCLWPTTTMPAEVFTLCRLDALGAGALVALLARGPEGQAWLRTVRRPLMWTMGSLVFCALAAKQLLQTSTPLAAQLIYWSACTPIAILFAGFVWSAVVAKPGSWMELLGRQRWLQLAGKYSYGWYVFQGLIVEDFDHYVTNDMLLHWCGGIPLGAFILRITLGGGISLLMAVVSWHLFEKQFLKWKPKHDRPPVAETMVIPAATGELAAGANNGG